MLSFPAPSWQSSLVPHTRALLAADRASPAARAASQILPRLYLADFFTAKDPPTLARLGITHVLSVLENAPTLPEEYSKEGRRMHVPVADNSSADLLSWFGRTTEFIANALNENDTNKVLVHCLQGISRSAAVVAAYLVATTDMIAPEAIAFAQAKRGIVCPNIGFRRQLDAYARPFYAAKQKQKKGGKGGKADGGKGRKTDGGGGEGAKGRVGAGIAERIRKLRRTSTREKGRDEGEGSSVKSLGDDDVSLRIEDDATGIKVVEADADG